MAYHASVFVRVLTIFSGIPLAISEGRGEDAARQNPPVGRIRHRGHRRLVFIVSSSVLNYSSSCAGTATKDHATRRTATYDVRSAWDALLQT